MRRIFAVIIIIRVFLQGYVYAATPNEAEMEKVAREIFTEYRLALKFEDYKQAFSLEPDFIQETAGSLEKYIEWWSGHPESIEWRNLYSDSKIEKVELLTPNRALIIPYPSDKRLDRAAFYVFRENDKWKVGCFEHIILQTKKELEEAKYSILLYCMVNDKLPSDLSELVPEYMENLPADLFNEKNEFCKYIIDTDGNYTVYSYGPGSDDDFGKIEYSYGEDGLLGDGDIVVKGTVVP